MHSREVAAAVEQNAGSVHRVLSSNKSSGEYPRDNSPGLSRSTEVRLPAFQDYGNSFSDDEYGQNCATHWKALTDRFFPNGWLAGDDDDAAMKNDEMLCGLYDYLEQAEDDYFGHDCLLEVWNLWQQNYAPECPEIIEHHMFPKYYGSTSSAGKAVTRRS